MDTKIPFFFNELSNQKLETVGGSRVGGGRGPDPLKNYKNIGFLSNTGQDLLKNHTATKPAFNVGPPWVASETPLKRCFAGGAMMARFSWYLDPLAPHQLKKHVVRVGPPLTKLSGSAHGKLERD